MKKKLPLSTVRLINLVITMIIIAFCFVASALGDDHFGLTISIVVILLVIDIGFMLIFWRCPYCGKLLQFTGPIEHCGHCGKKLD